jgi:hypothetical protein
MRIREAMRQFCTQTKVWTEKILVDSVEDQAAYDVEPSEDAYIGEINSVKTRTSDSVEFDSTTAIDPTRYNLNSNALGITFRSGYEPSASVTNGIQVDVVLVPTIEAEEFSGALLDRYSYPIYSLVKHKLMMTPKTSYTNPQLAQYWGTEYDRFRADAVKDRYTEHKNQVVIMEQRGGLL